MKKTPYIFALIISMLFAAPVWADNTQDGPKAVVESTISAMLVVLESREDKSKITTQNRTDIRQIIKGKFDYRTMAKRSLGKPWKERNEEERKHFTDVFRDLLEHSYGNRLSAYKGQKVVYEDAEIKKKKARVKTTVIDGERKTPVNYRLHLTKSGWQVYDILIEGTSLVRTFNQDFKSTLEGKGGYSKLVTALEQKVAKLQAKDQD